MSEDRAARLKRMRMRSWRRGIRETDIILGSWADRNLAQLDSTELDVYDRLLAENDHDIYAWVARREAPPSQFADLIDRIAEDQSRESDTH